MLELWPDVLPTIMIGVLLSNFLGFQKVGCLSHHTNNSPWTLEFFVFFSFLGGEYPT